MTRRHIGQATAETFTLVPQCGHMRELREAQTGHPKLSGGSREPQWMQNTGRSLGGGTGVIGWGTDMGGSAGGTLDGTDRYDGGAVLGDSGSGLWTGADEVTFGGTDGALAFIMALTCSSSFPFSWTSPATVRMRSWISLMRCASRTRSILLPPNMMLAHLKGTGTSLPGVMLMGLNQTIPPRKKHFHCLPLKIYLTTLAAHSHHACRNLRG